MLYLCTDYENQVNFAIAHEAFSPQKIPAFGTISWNAFSCNGLHVYRMLILLLKSLRQFVTLNYVAV